MRPSVPLSFFLGLKTNLHLLRKPWPWLLSILITPIDFLRYREFEFAFTAINRLCPNLNLILDISSPKLLPITVSFAKYSSIVISGDILQKEVNLANKMKKRLSLRNMSSLTLDVRSLPFKDCTFDLITSISVFEHIAPEKNGDSFAIREVVRILKPGGMVLLTVPFARDYFAEYFKKSVYERSQANSNEHLFFQRFYDMELIKRIFIESSGLKLEYLGFIYERFFSRNPHKRLAHYINGSIIQKILFGPFYPLFSRVFLSAPQPLKAKGKPYIACLILKKDELLNDFSV